MSHPTPSNLRKLSGSNLHRLNKNEPRVYCYRKVESVPTPKAVERDTYAKEEWTAILPDLVTNGLVTRANLGILASYCIAFANAMHADDDVFENGRYIEIPVFNKNGDHVNDRKEPNPALNQGNKFRLEMLRYAQEFGMTPSSATRISANPEGTAEAGFEQFTVSEDETDETAPLN